MKRFFTCIGATMLVAGVMTPAPHERMNLKDCGMALPQKEVKAKGLDKPLSNPSGQEVTPLRAPQKASMERKSIILYEDFSNVPDGSTVQTGNIGERYVDFIASSYYEPGNFIPNEYTPESGTWCGDWVFAGKGGTVILQCYNPYSGAYLYTPLGDFSGDLTVSMKVRCAKTFWGADNEVGYVTSGGSSLDLRAMVGGFDSNDSAVTDLGYYGMSSTGQIYPADGWQEVTFKFRNESANGDGYLMLSTAGAIEIDWIKITDDNTFLACPNIRPVTDFTNDGFTINWDPVRRSSNYYIDLYKQVYTADSGVNITYDFNDGKLPEGTKADEAKFVEGEGVDGSTALMLGYDGEGAAFETPNFGVKLKSFNSKLKFEINDEENFGAMIVYDVLSDNGWEPFGYLEYDGFWTNGGYYYSVPLSGKNFEDQYYAVRFYTIGLSPENKVYIDDINAFSPRPYVLERVWDENLSANYGPVDDDDYSYKFYYYTRDNDTPGKYTFTGLDPETEYWYRVRSHNVSEFTIGEKYHAFGVAAPKLGEASNVSNGSYTANWTDAPKAQSYTAINYKSEAIQEDNDEYTILSETFANCIGDNDIDLMVPFEGNLDDVTDLKGWSGTGLTIGGNLLGISGYGSRLITPPLMVNPARGSYFIYINAYGYGDDNLYIRTESGTVSGYLPFDGDGCLSGWLEIPKAICGERILFTSLNYMPIALIEFEVIQAVKAGDRVLTFLSSEEIPAGVQSCTFSGLDKSSSYAFGVKSNFTLEQKSTSSALNEWMYVDIAGAQSITMATFDNNDPNVTETDRYTVDGRKASNSYKGMVIVKMSDGSVAKRMVK
ncbi:MAG: hypothetical protein K2H38_03905 [Muribaculaceae bacterium]|nr:hypothetical protein [Muribaculaceae bacterium]MDE6551780.1 hypothetical protein [Muribaculaceae bacterium]